MNVHHLIALSMHKYRKKICSFVRVYTHTHIHPSTWYMHAHPISLYFFNSIKRTRNLFQSEKKIFSTNNKMVKFQGTKTGMMFEMALLHEKKISTKMTTNLWIDTKIMHINNRIILFYCVLASCTCSRTGQLPNC